MLKNAYATLKLKKFTLFSHYFDYLGHLMKPVKL